MFPFSTHRFLQALFCGELGDIMKQEINLLKVPFFGAELLLVEHNEQPYVVMKTITESIGLSWQGQHEKLLEHFSKGIKEILIPTNGGVQQMICMNLRKFPAWLYSLQPKKISDPIKRAKIIAFKEECDEVLWQYWTTGIATRETVKEKLAEIDEFEKLSKQNGTNGSRLMLQRKKEIKEIEMLRANVVQLDLFQHFNLTAK